MRIKWKLFQKNRFALTYKLTQIKMLNSEKVNKKLKKFISAV